MEMMRNKSKVVAAVDEAGRGPLAGPIAVAAVVATGNLKSLKNIRDSKKLSEKQREEWFKILKNHFECRVAMVGPQVIDRIGINPATRLAISRLLRRFNKKPDLVILDGALSAPCSYNQQTIVKGDEKIPLISAASIIAKVSRDRKMRRFHKTHPEYCFDKHKGYGTKAHYRAIKKNGLLEIHRRSFLKTLNCYNS